MDWVEFIQWNEKRTTADQLYLAQVAAEIRRGHVKHPKEVKIQDFILRFGTPPAEKVDPKEKLEASKRAWLGALQLDPKKKKRKRNA